MQLQQRTLEALVQGWHSIDVDDDVMDALKSEAEPFIDSPNSVLRRKYGLPAAAEQRDGEDAPARDGGAAPSGHERRTRRAAPGASRGTGRRSRVPHGELLPESEYELPILKALDERGGRGATREIVEAVGVAVDGKLRPLDREDMPNGGGARWQNRVQFARLALVREGLLKKDSPRGVWELSDVGRERLAKEAST